MDFLRTFFLSSLLCTPALGGIYECAGINAKPERSKKATPEISIQVSEPNFRTGTLEKSVHFTQKPFLIYYTIDTDEPFMRYAVDFEVASLKKSCETSGDVQFAVILNSLYLKSNAFIICKDGNLSQLSIDQFPSFNESLRKKHKYISEGDHTFEEQGTVEFPVDYEPVNNGVFAQYPLSHPDFLFEFMRLLISEKTLFPTKDYLPFLNLKSHGNKNYVLSGLHACQLQSKKVSQEEFIREKLNPNDKEVLTSTNRSDDSFATVLDSLLLGPSLARVRAEDVQAGLGNYALGNYALGNYALGNYALGNYALGVAGLGSHGLGAEYAFGTYHLAVNAVLRKLFNEQNGKVMGFVMFESCDTNRDPLLNHTTLVNTLGFYSAKHSLWYRNLNWWTLLESAKGSSSSLLNLLDTETRLIPNLKIIEK